VKRLALAALLLPFLAACGNDKPCLHYHRETVTTYVMVGKVMVPIVEDEQVCDRRVGDQ